MTTNLDANLIKHITDTVNYLGGTLDEAGVYTAGVNRELEKICGFSYSELTQSPLYDGGCGFDHGGDIMRRSFAAKMKPAAFARAISVFLGFKDASSAATQDVKHLALRYNEFKKAVVALSYDKPDEIIESGAIWTNAADGNAYRQLPDNKLLKFSVGISEDGEDWAFHLQMSDQPVQPGILMPNRTTDSLGRAVIPDGVTFGTPVIAGDVDTVERKFARSMQNGAQPYRIM